MVNASLQFDAATLTPTYRFLKGVPGRSYGLAIARRLGVSPEILADAERPADAEQASTCCSLSRSASRLARRQVEVEERANDQDAFAARLAVQQAPDRARGQLRRRDKEAERAGRQQARAYLLEARELVGTLAAARSETAAKEARRMVEDGIRAQGEELERVEQDDPAATSEQEDSLAVETGCASRAAGRGRCSRSAPTAG